MKRTALLKGIKPCKAPKTEPEKDRVIAVSQIGEIDGEEYLNIDLYYMGELKGRYFADVNEKSHAAYVNGKWYGCMINNVARLCMGLETNKGGCYYYTNEWEYNTEEDKERVGFFLGVYSIDSFESSSNAVKYNKAYERKQKRINEVMDEIPCVPDEVDAWLKEQIFPEQYLFFKKGEKRTEYQCTACGTVSWKKKGWKHGERTVCPRCGKEVIAYNRKQEVEKKAPVVLLQTYAGKWVERQFRAKCVWTAGEKQIHLFEEVRAVIPKGQVWGKLYYGTYSDADEFKQEFWDKNQQNKRFLNSYLYPGNLDEVLPYGNLEHSGIALMAQKKQKINVNKFITTFHQRRWLEYLIKAGLFRLAAEIVSEYGWYGGPGEINQIGKNLRECLKLDGNRVNRMKQIDGGLRTLEWLQYEQEHDVKITQESLEYINNKKVSKSDCREILEELGSVNRMVNYMKKQKMNPKTLTQTWRDYLNMARLEGLDTRDDIVRLPRDLKARHDALVEIRNARADEQRIQKDRKKYDALDAKILERLPQAKIYFWENEQYMIIPAGKCSELMEEGRKLHHCVGSSDTYMQKMARGDSWILFLRKKEELEKPYYTVEINMRTNEILQWYSEFDRKPDQEEIKGVLKRFRENLRWTEQKVAIA